MTKTLNINGESFSYEEEILTYENTKPMSEEEGKALLHKVKELLDAKGIEFMLGYGTLLGAVRNHGIIPGDEDLDIIVRDEKRLQSLLPYLRDNGIQLIRHYIGNVYSFRMGANSYIDIYILRRIPKTSIWSLYCYSIAEHEYVPKWLVNKTQPIEFLGATFKCPRNPERLLEFWYGKTWRTPVSGHNFYYCVKSYWHWRHTVKPGLQRLLMWPYWRHLVSKRFKTQRESLEDWKLYNK